MSRRASIGRRAAMLAPLALGGCGLWNSWFGEHKTPLAGKREPIAASRGGLTVDEGVPKVVLPPPVRNAAWPQAGGNPRAFHGTPRDRCAARRGVERRYRRRRRLRRKIMAQPVAADGTIYVMDSDAVVSAYQHRQWFPVVALRHQAR